MLKKLMTISPRTQGGASLIEVLVAIVILSFGMLAIGGMLSYAVQMPKLSGYRSSATSIASAHIEHMRANAEGFRNGHYASGTGITAGEPHSYDIQFWKVFQLHPNACAYPTCNAASIAWANINETHFALRSELPGFAGMRVTCSGTCDSEGDIWIIWSEPANVAAIDGGTSDECPDPSSTPPFAAFSSPKPRCLHMRFKL